RPEECARRTRDITHQRARVPTEGCIRLVVSELPYSYDCTGCCVSNLIYITIHACIRYVDYNSLVLSAEAKTPRRPGHPPETVHPEDLTREGSCCPRRIRPSEPCPPSAGL